MICHGSFEKAKKQIKINHNVELLGLGDTWDMKSGLVKVAQSCLTLCHPRDYTVHGILQARILEWVAFPFSRGIFLIQETSRSSRIQEFPIQESPALQRILYKLNHKGSPRILEWVAYPFSSGYSWPRNQTRVSCIAGRFFTNWAIREAGRVG